MVKTVYESPNRAYEMDYLDGMRVVANKDDAPDLEVLSGCFFEIGYEKLAIVIQSIAWKPELAEFSKKLSLEMRTLLNIVIDDIEADDYPEPEDLEMNEADPYYFKDH